ncbi:tropomyosin-1, isoforms 33/34-like [Magallana gigas]|uniref:tropomyosin-1, isoforms 33/34-like n=1 Tax=Magallana gigas TaxID=29159 RepID=UPI003342783F
MAEVNPPCISCGREVRPKQHAVSCDACEGWQHRLCNTGITFQQYNAAKHGREEIHWFCRPCEDRYWPNPADAPAADAPVPDADPADAPAPDADPADAPAPDDDPADAPAPDDDPADAPAPDADPADLE